MLEPLRALRPACVPIGIVAAAALLAWLAPPLPAQLEGLRTAGPYALLIPAVGLAWWFNRGRSFVLAASLLAAFAGFSLVPTPAVYAAITVLVPLNALAAMVLAERGARHGAAWRWLAVLALEALLVAWIGSAGRHAFSGTSWEAILGHWLLRSPPAPLLGRLAFAAAFAAALWRSWPEHSPLQAGNAAGLAAFLIAVWWGGEARAFPMFMAAAGAILIVALLAESHRLAFRDSLTGLPGRRALEERLRSLGERYAIAMVDVDRFKPFNDRHGHDIGDQVLKLVAGRLAQVGGGGTAYRYGGEEFSVVFPERSRGEVEGELEAMRASIENHRMALRGRDRPRKAEDGAKRRGAGASDKVLSVTVSIGVAGPSAKLATPQQVLKAADQALYRAKQGGRNRVSR
ncbi:MAG TPA: GGDEF domain-containing protein [Burkholderiales bacterium]|nr:GGDEF domain-containing protein [Burkholderiales bacterium]